MSLKLPLIMVLMTVLKLVSSSQKPANQIPTTQLSVVNDPTKFLSNSILIVTNEGLIYNYDYQQRQIVWTTNLHLTFRNWLLHGNNPFIPVDRGDFILLDRDKVVNVPHDELDTLFRKCDCFQRDLAFVNHQINFAINVNTGENHILSSEEILEFMTLPWKQQTYVILTVKQHFITLLEDTSCTQINSRLQLNLFQQFLKRQPNKVKELSDLKIVKPDQHTLKISTARQATFELQTEDNIIEIFGYDELDGIVSILSTSNMNLSALPESHAQYLQLFKLSSGQLQLGYQGSEEPLELITRGPIDEYIECISSTNQKYALESKDKNSSNSLELKPIQIGSYFQNESAETLLQFGFPLFIIVLVWFLYRMQPIKEVTTNSTIDKSTKSPQSKESSIQSNQQSSTDVPEEINNELLPPGKQKSLCFQFDKQSILGTGSNGTIVYGATFLGKEAALKRIRKVHLVDNLTSREVEIMLAMNHPNLVQMYYYHEDTKYVNIILEKCRFNLREFVEGQLKPEHQSIANELIGSKQTIWELSFQTLSALAYLQEKKFIHRDIKPDNVLLSTEGCFKIADFGISRCVDSSKQTKNLGTVGWRAREVIKKSVYSYQSDIFSLGCTIYFSATKGGHPFGNGNGSNRENRIADNKAMDLQTKNLHPELLDLIQIMISSEPQSRLSAKELLQQPYFWGHYQKINFIIEFSDYIETLDDKSQRKGQALQKYSYDSNLLFQPWNLSIDPCLFDNSTRAYDYLSTKHLIRFIRNCKNHFHEMSSAAQSVLGRSEQSFYEYWESRYPKLLLTLFKFAKLHTFALLTLQT